MEFLIRASDELPRLVVVNTTQDGKRRPEIALVVRDYDKASLPKVVMLGDEEIRVTEWPRRINSSDGITLVIPLLPDF
jgi:hypothetical protein